MEGKTAHEDQRYVTALLENDHRLIREIYTRFSGSVKSIVIRNSGNVHDAEDLFNELLMEICALARKGKFLLTCPFDAFIKMMAYRRWVNKLNKPSGKMVTFSDMQGYDEVADVEVNETSEAFDLVARKEALFKEKLAELSEGCREVLKLSWTVKPMEKVAEMLNVTYAYLRKRKSVCMKKLTELVRESPEYQLLMV
ncbi:MAG: sigma-70 family RNA polymerase sigma factor [Saprospiraceae bacterium]|nr:sigma-70 family RNA polymerase sigma factor [Saprospiraceae bacterium]MCB9325079.1 sigma-70 family RNA polymerase sigma factor [Lewinellaceae bacterium]